MTVSTDKRGMNDRIKRLRERSVTAEVRISLERAVIETETVRELEGKVSVPVMRASVLKRYMEQRKLYLGEDELIAGQKCDAPQAAPTFPELCCHTMQDLEVMNDRELISFSVSDEDRELQRDVVIPFWRGRSMRDRVFSRMTPEWKACYECGLFTEFMEQRGPGHTVGSENIFIKGFEEHKEAIANAIAALDFEHDEQAEERLQQLMAMDIACDAVITLGDRYAALAEQLASDCKDEKRRAELSKLAETCKVVPRHAPQTFTQAVQMYWLVHLCVTTELNPWDAYSPGRLDQHLYPFYKRDVEAGTLTRDGAKELLECLWVKFNDQPAPPKVGVTLKESSTYTDFANINTGGITKDGDDGVNDVSYIILDCMDEMRLLQPSSNVQISCKTPDEFLLRAVDIAREGWGQPAFYNTEAIVQELLNAGKSLEDAQKGGASGCVETGAFGNEAYILTGYFNLPKILEITLNNGLDPESGRQLGPKLGGAEDFESYDALFTAYRKQVEYFANIKLTGSNVIEELYAKFMPAPFLSVVTNDCIKLGKDYNAGGARYNSSYLQGVGIGTVTDCLSSIKHNVFEKKRFTMGELMAAMKNDFIGCEDMRGVILNHTPHYGNDDDAADDIMQSVFNMYYNTITGRPNYRGGMYRVNMLPTTCHVYFGEVMGASADGRRAHKPVSEGISPVQGNDTNGPTAVANSAAKMDQLHTGGTLLNQKFTPQAASGENGRRGIAALIRGYFAQNAHHIQFNVVDRETLLAAQRDPEAYRDLIVRVAGYSDHFRNLSKALQDEIIARTEQSL